MHKFLKIFFEAIFNLILVIVILLGLLAVYSFIQKNVLKKDYANIFGYSIFQVVTGSMSGTIEIGDIVIANITKEVNENDIIVFKEEKNIITHRLIKKDGEKFITKGDANNSEDKCINKEAIIGKVIKIIPNIAIIYKVIAQKEVYLSIIATLLLFGIAVCFSKKNKESLS